MFHAPLSRSVISHKASLETNNGSHDEALQRCGKLINTSRGSLFIYAAFLSRVCLILHLYDTLPALSLSLSRQTVRSSVTGKPREQEEVSSRHEDQREHAVIMPPEASVHVVHA